MQCQETSDSALENYDLLSIPKRKNQKKSKLDGDPVVHRVVYMSYSQFRASKECIIKMEKGQAKKKWANKKMGKNSNMDQCDGWYVAVSVYIYDESCRSINEMKQKCQVIKKSGQCL